MRHNIKRQKLLKTFLQYGLHLWLIIFLCNIAVVYAVRFFLFASTDTPTSTTTPAARYIPAAESTPLAASKSASASRSAGTSTPKVTSKPTATPTLTPTPTPIGPIVKVDLILPGISTNGGNIKPIHPKRDISINLYSPDANISDQKVKPLYAVRAKVNFDADKDSPTYTHFTSDFVDLGEVKQGKYQIAIHTQQALLSVIKDPEAKPSKLGGKVFSLKPRGLTIIPEETMISGDIYPPGNNDNVMDINDYNMLANCFSNSIDSSKCPDSSHADLDDNGVVDGVDYNIMLLSFSTLKSLGYPIPAIITPTSVTTITKAPTSIVSITPPTEQIKSSGGGGIAIVVFVVLLLILVTAGFILFKFHILKIETLKNLLSRIHIGGKNIESQGADVAGTEESNVEGASTGDDVNIIEKSGYLKKLSTDAQTNDTWVTIADDGGVTTGLYKGKDAIEGFVKVKGTMQLDKDNKEYMLISAIEEEK